MRVPTGWHGCSSRYLYASCARTRHGTWTTSERAWSRAGQPKRPRSHRPLAIRNGWVMTMGTGDQPAAVAPDPGTVPAGRRAARASTAIWAALVLAAVTGAALAVPAKLGEDGQPTGCFPARRPARLFGAGVMSRTKEARSGRTLDGG